MRHYLIFFTFFFISWVIAYFFYVWPFSIIGQWLFLDSIELSVKLSIAGIIAMLITYYLRSSSTFFLFRWIVYEGMGIGFISFGISLGMMVVDKLFPFQSFLMGIISLSLIALVVIFAYLAATKIKIRHIQLSMPSTKLKTMSRFVFISDIHLGSNSIKHLEKIIQNINVLDVDMLFIGGDLIDSNSFQSDQLSPFLSLNIPIYFVTGNHEYYLKNWQVIQKDLKKYNIHWLNNDCVEHNGLNIIGLNDNQNHELKAKILQTMMKSNCVNVALVHKPCLWKNLSDKPELMLSGHTHAGQIWPFHWLVKRQFSHYYGRYQEGKKTLVVSSGAGTWGPRIRLGSSNEILVFELSMDTEREES